ncbi:DinB family protein [Nocardia sp. NPDC052566]|uniref:DinB family protein n=1 Tax=Nocardia sp. NPDC052566 TaxID=3364330 RepID=UPI0037CA1ED2
MNAADPKADLHRYLRVAREALVWKLDGLSDYEVRRPMVATGTNLLGLIKHLAYVEFGYFGTTFGRPHGVAEPDFDADPTVDMWAAPDESREEILDLYRRAWAHSDATIEALPLDAIGHVPHWSKEHATVTLHQILVHVLAETNRHAGHADILRELIDGTVGHRDGNDNMPPGETDWRHYRDKLEQVARSAS